MNKIIYLILFFAVVSIISCKKDTSTTPKSNTSTGMVSGDIYTIAGDNNAGYTGDGMPATSSGLFDPLSAAIDYAGNIYIADQANLRIRKVNTSGIISTIAENGTQGYSGDGGPATVAELSGPYGVTVDGSGNVYFSDFFNHRIRMVSPSGIISTFAGNGTEGYSGDGGAATSAQLNLPTGVAVDGSGNVYIVAVCVVRKVNTSGTISTVAGIGTNGYSGDDGPATAAEIEPSAVAIDGSGNIFISDEDNYRIREVNTSGIISTVAGNGIQGLSGNGGPATASEIGRVTGVAVDALGNLYIAENSNNLIRIVNTSGIISTYAGSGNGTPNSGSFSGDGGPATLAELNNPDGVSVDASGNVYISDSDNQRVRKVIK